jgi:hypothetical protein
MTINQPSYPINASGLVTHVGSYTDTQVSVVKEAALNPMDAEFAAAGNGTTDDVTALDAVVTKAKTATNGGHVYLPNRQFAVSRPWVINADNLSVTGPGRGTPTGGSAGSGVPVYGGAVIRPTSSFTGGWVIDVAEQGTPTHALTGVNLKDFAIDGFRLPGVTGGIHYQAQRSVIEDVTIARVTGPGVYVEAVNHATAFPGGCFDIHLRGVIVTGTSIQSQHGIWFSPGASDSILEGCIVRKVQSGYYGIYMEGSGQQIIGGLVELCDDWGIYWDSARNQKARGVRVVECQGGIRVRGSTTLAGGDWSITGCSIRNCSEGGDGARDGILVDPTGVIRGGVIDDIDFSTVTRNTSNGYRVRYGVNIDTANAEGVTIGSMSAGWTNPPATGAFQTAPVRDTGTRTVISGALDTNLNSYDQLGNGVLRLTGTGTPEGARTAPPGSTYLDTNGPLWNKRTGTGNTGWTTPPYILGQGAVASSVTGTLTETTLATVTVPAGAIGPNGRLRITSLWSVTNSANTKTLRVKLAAQSFLSAAVTAVSAGRWQQEIANRNSQSSQVSSNSGGGGGGWSTTTTTVTATAVNTAVAQDITITGTLANTGETITLESYLVELIPG